MTPSNPLAASVIARATPCEPRGGQVRGQEKALGLECRTKPSSILCICSFGAWVQIERARKTSNCTPNTEKSYRSLLSKEGCFAFQLPCEHRNHPETEALLIDRLNSLAFPHPLFTV